jgi:hypothetical protein
MKATLDGQLRSAWQQIAQMFVELPSARSPNTKKATIRLFLSKIAQFSAFPRIDTICTSPMNGDCSDARISRHLDGQFRHALVG